MAKSRIYFGIWVFFVLCMYVLFGTAVSGLLLFVTGLLFLWCVCSIFLLKNKLDGTFEIQQTAEKKKRAGGILKVQNRSLIPAGKVSVELEFFNQLTGERKTRQILCSVGAKQEETVEWSLESAYCGRIRVKIKKLTAYDFLGLFGIPEAGGAKASVVVLPDIFHTELEISDGMMVNWESVHYSELKKGDDSSEIFGIREYQEGDSLKNIHWKLSGKLGEFYVKESSLPTENAVLLFFETARLDKRETVPLQSALMEAFLSFSQSLAESGYVHALGWYDQKQERLCMERVDSEDALAQISQGLLALEGREKEFSGLHEYLQKYPENPFDHVVYFTAQEPGEECRLLSEFCSFSAVCCTENAVDGYLSFTPETMQEKLCRVVI